MPHCGGHAVRLRQYSPIPSAFRARPTPWSRGSTSARMSRCPCFGVAGLSRRRSRPRLGDSRLRVLHAPSQKILRDLPIAPRAPAGRIARAFGGRLKARGALHSRLRFARRFCPRGSSQYKLSRGLFGGIEICRVRSRARETGAALRQKPRRHLRVFLCNGRDRPFARRQADRRGMPECGNRLRFKNFHKRRVVRGKRRFCPPAGAANKRRLRFARSIPSLRLSALPVFPKCRAALENCLFPFVILTARPFGMRLRIQKSLQGRRIFLTDTGFFV